MFIWDVKTIEPWTFNANGDSIPGPLIIGTFEKRAPGVWKMEFEEVYSAVGKNLYPFQGWNNSKPSYDMQQREHLRKRYLENSGGD